MSAILSACISIADKICGKRWPGFKPVKECQENGYHVYKLIADGNNEGCRCPKCGQMCYKPHSRQWREAYEAPLQPHDRSKITCQVRRFYCSCGFHFTERLEFLEPRARITKAMTLYAQEFMRLCSFTLSDVRMITGLSVTTLKKIDKIQLKFLYDNISFDSVTNIAIDEFSVFHNHKYATVVIDNDTCRVLWVGRGKSKKSVQPFFDKLKEAGVAGNIRSVSCDQNAAYPSLVRDNLPNAVIIYDFFHVMAHWHDDVVVAAKKKTIADIISRVTKEIQDKASKEKRTVSKSEIGVYVHNALKGMSGVDWAMVTPLTNDLKPDKKQRYQQMLDTVVKDNALLAVIYPISEALHTLWREKSVPAAQKRLEDIRQLLLTVARNYNFKPAKSFAMMLKRRADGILQAGRFGYTTSRLEGANNKIKVIKRTAFGYRDLDYFFLRIKAALPGKSAVPMFEQLDGQAVIGSQLWQGAWKEVL